MGKNNINICIIPAAGKGSRWAPISGYLPKEMLPLVDRPVIEWVIEEVAASGCPNIVVIINKQKEIIKEYLTKNRALTKRIHLSFIYQNQPLGIAHTFYLARKFIRNSPFAVALPDLPTIAHKPVLKQLIDSFQNNNSQSHMISLNSFPPNTLHFYSECLTQSRNDQLLEIIHLCPKNQSRNQSHHPGNKIRMSGRYILLPTILPIIEKLITQKSNKEIKDIDALELALIKGQKILGIEIQGHTYDTGNPVSYIRANTAFFKKKRLLK